MRIVHNIEVAGSLHPIDRKRLFEGIQVIKRQSLLLVVPLQGEGIVCHRMNPGRSVGDRAGGIRLGQGSRNGRIGGRRRYAVVGKI